MQKLKIKKFATTCNGNVTDRYATAKKEQKKKKEDLMHSS
jgi:hypothetical protein